MNRGTILLLGAIAQIALTALFVWRVVPSIEEDLRQRAERALGGRNVHWARVEVDGRDVTVSGLAPNDRQRQRALDTLAEIDGIRRVEDRITGIGGAATASATGAAATAGGEARERRVADAPVPDADALLAELQAVGPGAGAYEFRIERSAGIVTVSGVAPDRTARETLVGLARERFGGTRIIDRLGVDPDAPPGFLFAATQAMRIAALVSEGATGVRDRQVYVEGLTGNDRDLARVREVIAGALPEGYTTSLQLSSRQTLEAALRENPDLAARVGPLPSLDGRSGVIDLGVARAIDRSPEAAARCQAAFDELTGREKIAFDTGSADVSEASQALLDKLVETAKGCPDARIEIAGHTDDQGTESNNLALSQRRAEAVMEYFVRQGISLSRLSAVGYGEGRPLVENRTAADRARNRRIEFVIS